MRHALGPFNLTTLHKYFCFNEIDDHYPEKALYIDITSEDSFFLNKLFFDPKYNLSLPLLTPSLVDSMSEHFITVYTALWSNTHEHIVRAAFWLIQSKLDNDLHYTTVHKRSLEGGCNKVLSSLSSISDYPADQIAKNLTIWQGNLNNYHPICEMPAAFAVATQNLRNHSNSKIFVAYDGRGNIDDYTAIHAIFSSDLDRMLFPAFVSTNDRKFLDMFIGINSGLFLLNPYSTFSFQIYIIRECLSLESVPALIDRDLYFKTANLELGEILWVGWDSIHRAAQRIKSKLTA